MKRMYQFEDLPVGEAIAVPDLDGVRRKWTKQDDGTFVNEDAIVVAADLFKPAALAGVVVEWNRRPEPSEYYADATPNHRNRFYGILSVSENSVRVVSFHYHRFAEVTTMPLPIPPGWTRIESPPAFWPVAYDMGVSLSEQIQRATAVIEQMDTVKEQLADLRQELAI